MAHSDTAAVQVPAQPSMALAGLRVLRLCSVFEPRTVRATDAGYDVLGGMQNHTGELTRCLDRVDVRQIVVTSRLADDVGSVRFARRSVVVRRGVRSRRARQLWAACALPVVLRLRGIDLVHGHQGEDLAVLPLAWLAAAWQHCPLVVTVHSSVAHTVIVRDLGTAVLHSIGGLVERIVLRRADAVICLTAAAAQRVQRDGVDAGRIRQIPSGVDPTLFTQPLADPFSQLPHPRVAYIGRLHPQKRVDILLKAFALVSGPASLVLVGDGPQRARLERQAHHLGIDERTLFAGFCPHDAVPSVLANVDVLVLPSAYEELGSVLVEAMAAGLAVVATRVGGIPEVVTDGVTGLLVPPGNPTAMAGAIARVLGDERLRTRFDRAAQAASDRYAWPVLAEQILDLYRSVTTQAGVR